jgi:DNA-3-methyladenine glycosylase
MNGETNSPPLPGRFLSPEFFLRHPAETAPDLLGKIFVRVEKKKIMAVRIVETEAYAQDDPASHSYRGKSARNQAMFQKGGCLYVYLIYGMYHCLNIVTEEEGRGSAVLIRAGEPLLGQETMRRNRYPGSAEIPAKTTLLCSGPGRLASALGLTRKDDGLILNRRNVFLLDDGFTVPPANRARSERIGISAGKDKRWRWYIKDNPWVSRGKPITSKK